MVLKIVAVVCRFWQLFGIICLHIIDWVFLITDACLSKLQFQVPTGDILMTMVDVDDVNLCCAVGLSRLAIK